MGIINVLSPQVANLIAAGEVVDRPASVIKELMENAIDAGSTEVTVEIKHGGITFMRVSDNGCGMSREDVPVCIKRHATSKIRTENDLDGIATLGFRGEALAAIGSVSTLKIFTKQHGQLMGTQLTSRGGEIEEIVEAGCRDGTTIIVEELFANVPARRKFLKKDTSEALAVLAVVEKVALSRPELAIKFISDGVIKFSTAGDGSLRNCIYAVLGREFSKKLVSVHGMTGGIEVEGFVGTPENIRANRNYQNFFINGRYVKSRTAMAALEQAFTSYIPSEKFPVCVIRITIHPALVDVNVHPTKLEVKFSNEQAVFDAVYSAVRSSLEKNLSLPVFNLKTKEEARRESRLTSGFVPLKDTGERQSGGSYKPYESVEKRMQAVSDMHLYSSHAEETKKAGFGSVPITSAVSSGGACSNSHSDKDNAPSLPFSVDSEINTENTEPPMTEKAGPIGNLESFVRDIPVDVSDKKNERGKENVFDDSAFGLPVIIPPKKNTEPEKTVNGSNRTENRPAELSSLINDGQLTETVKEQKCEPEYSVSNINRGSARNEITDLPEYKILGEAFNSYIILETEGKLLMIDKHAAHERILFEDMKRNLSNGANSQMLMLPLEIMLSPAEIDSVSDYQSEIRSTGFEFSVNGSGGVTVNAIPAGLSATEAEEFFVSVAGRIASGTGSLETARQEFYEQALYQASCKAAIKAGRIYDTAHTDWVCRQVLSNPAVRFCPHGRPVAFELSKGEIEHWFKRK